MAVVTGQPSGAATEIRFRNEVGNGFKMIGAELVVDGQHVRTFSAADVEGAAGQRQLSAHLGRLPAGTHLVTARLQFQGRRQGPFSYMDKYQLNVETSGAFVIPDKRTAAGFTVVARERKGANIPLERRLEVAIERISGL